MNKNNEYLASLMLLSPFCHLDYELEGEKLSLYPQISTENLYEVTRTTKAGGSVKSGNYENTTFYRGQLCRLIERVGSFSLVKTLDDDVWYVLSSDIEKTDEKAELPDFFYAEKEKTDSAAEKISMVWDTVSTESDAMRAPILNGPGAIPGIDVIAVHPWFYQIVDGGGAIGNNANLGYTQACHKNGYRVWACITNDYSTKGSSKFTRTVFDDPELMKKTAAQYLLYAALYDVDGINVDYEDLYVGSDYLGSGFSEFISILSEYTDRMGLDLSVATYAPLTSDYKGNYKLYEYDVLGELCDYITVMTYDQHWSVDSGAGSTSSIPWFRDQLETLSRYVDPEKIIAGVPLYSFVNKYDANGVFTACGKSSAKNFINSNIPSAILEDRIVSPVVWDDVYGQYYIEYMCDGYLYKVWLEETRSVAQRLAVVLDLDIAGTACWEFDYVDPSFYQLFEDVFRYGEDPSLITPDYPVDTGGER